MQRVYLDHAATSPLRPEAAEAMQRAWQLVGNPSSLHSDGRAAAKLLEQCRDRVARVFACRSSDVIFNSGGSEGDTHALLGVAELVNSVRWGDKHSGLSRRPLRIAVSSIEHKAVLHSAEKLAAAGHALVYIPVSKDGVVDLDWLVVKARNPGLDLVSVMAVNNEVGTIQPVAEIASLCEAAGAVYHCDAVQVPGHRQRQILTLSKIPLLTISGHKFGGARGTGLLIQRGEQLAKVLGSPGRLELRALICGGQQEHGCRAGTENLAGIAGLVAALELAETTDFSAAVQRGIQRNALESGLHSLWPECIIHGESKSRCGHITSVSLTGVKGRDIQRKLDRAGISVGLGSACTGCSRGISHVLSAMGLPKGVAESTIRISLGWNTEEDDLARLLVELATVEA